MMRLQDPERTKVMIVTLAETTPVLEPLGYRKSCAVPVSSRGPG